MYFCREKYRLELRWGKTEKVRDGICNIKGAYFFGPAIKIAQKINGSDNITIDLTPQYSKIISSYYFVNLSWKTVEYKDDKVYLGEAVLSGEYINELSRLDNTDGFTIDTEKHEEKKHLYNLVYKGMVFTKEGKEKV